MHSVCMPLAHNNIISLSHVCVVNHVALGSFSSFFLYS